jgi:hypothetical protein
VEERETITSAWRRGDGILGMEEEAGRRHGGGGEAAASAWRRRDSRCAASTWRRGDGRRTASAWRKGDGGGGTEEEEGRRWRLRMGERGVG